MNKRAHKNSNKCIKKLLRHIFQTQIQLYWISLETHLSKNSYNTETSQLIYKVCAYGFLQKGFRNRLEYTFFHRNQSSLLLFQFFYTVGPHNSLILFLLTECIKRMYSKHSKNTKSHIYPRFSSLKEKMKMKEFELAIVKL